MKKNRKIGIILLLIVFLPGLFFSVYEIGSLNRNEKILEDIYNKQLDVITYSVNQYSSDFASSWSINLNNIFSNFQKDLFLSLKQFTYTNSSIKGVFYQPDTSSNSINVVLQDNSILVSHEQAVIKTIFHNNLLTINKLYQYIQGGYRKIEAFNSSQSPNLSYFVFICDNQNGNKMLCGVIIDANTFVRQVLYPKIQAIVEDNFIISVIDQKKNEVVYTSERSKFGNISRLKSLWLLPNLKLGMINKGKTIEQLVRERTYVNFALILLLDILFITGTWYVFRSIKTQIQLGQMRADFISNVSHEIRTPLALISVYIETILLGRLKSEKLQEYYQIIYQETNRLTNIVNKILNFSKIEERKYNYTFIALDLNEVIENVFQRYDYHLRNKDFVVEKILDPKLPLIQGDREALYEVIMNLVDNAIKYSLDDKYISIKSFKEVNKVVVEVADRGIGIPENQQKYVFDKFFRVTEGEVQSVRGSGLGLAIVKHIIEGHNATISLSSFSGKGSIFRLEFVPYSLVDNNKSEIGKTKLKKTK